MRGRGSGEEDPRFPQSSPRQEPPSRKPSSGKKSMPKTAQREYKGFMPVVYFAFGAEAVNRFRLGDDDPRRVGVWRAICSAGTAFFYGASFAYSAFTGKTVFPDTPPFFGTLMNFGSYSGLAVRAPLLMIGQAIDENPSSILPGEEGKDFTVSDEPVELQPRR